MNRFPIRCRLGHKAVHANTAEVNSTGDWYRLYDISGHKVAECSSVYFDDHYDIMPNIPKGTGSENEQTVNPT